MSYCRFSSDNFMSDVYVYADADGGWTTHVAGNRLRWPPVPELPIWLFDFGGRIDAESCKVVYPSRWAAIKARLCLLAWLWSHRLHHWSIGVIPMESIRLQHAGKTFNHDTPFECALFLGRLRDLGYRVPQFAIDALEEEVCDDQ